MEVPNKRKKEKMKIGGVLVLAFLLIYIPSLCFWLFGRTIETDMIRIGTIEDAVNTTAVFVRNEEVLKSPFDGKCIPEVNEGEKVPANFRVATVMKADSSSLVEKMKEYDLRILEIQSQKAGNQEMFSEDIIRLDSEISKKVKELVELSQSNNLTKLVQLREDMDQLLQKKALIMGETGAPDANLASVKNEKAKLQAQINANKTDILSKVPGIISFIVDGYENELNSVSIKNMTPASLENIKQGEIIKGSLIRSAVKDKPFAKIIRDIDYYAVFSLDSAQVNTYMLGDTVKVRINDIGKVLEGMVEYKSNQQENKNILAVRLDRGLMETAGLRKVNADLIHKSYEGWKVPLKSLIQADYDQMKAKIILSKANSAIIREVKIKGKNNDFAIIENVDPAGRNGVSLYDIFVVNPGNIEEGQMINP